MDVLCGVDFDLGAVEAEEESTEELLLPFQLSDVARATLLDRSTIETVKNAQVAVKGDSPTEAIQLETLKLVESFLEGDLCAVLNGPVAQAILRNCKLDEIRSRIVDVVQEAPCSNTTMALRGLQVMLVGAASIQLFVQANWTGPPVSAEPVAALASVRDAWFVDNKELLVKVQSTESEEWNGFSRLVDDKLQLEVNKIVSDIAEVDGEGLYFDAQFPQMLLLGRHVLRILVHGTNSKNRRTDQGDRPLDNDKVMLFDVEHARFPPTVLKSLSTLRDSIVWWGMRAASVHQQSLESVEVSNRLWTEFETAANEYSRKQSSSLSNGDEDEENLSSFQVEVDARFWTEYGMGCHHFEKVELAKTSFEAARKSVGLSVKLSGAWGKRTKFQQTDKSQLVILAESSTTTKQEAALENTSTSKLPTTPEEKQATQEANQEPQLSGDNEKAEFLNQSVVTLDKIDPDTPLLERVKFSDAERDSLARSGKLSQIDECILLALCVDVRNSYAMEELTAEEMKAYVDRVTLHQQNWSVFSAALLVKSQLEFERFKTKERAVLQMQVLVDQQSDRLTPVQARTKLIEESAGCAERLEWVHALAVPSLWRLKRELGLKYKTLGVAGSALEIFTQLHSWDEAVECLVMMDKRARAEALIRERLEVEESPKLMCILGDLLQEPEWFVKAWEVSKNRYARAMRMHGQYLFDKGQLKLACESYQKALAINPQFASGWFRLGVAAMRLADWPLAKRAFVQVVSLEPSDGDSWANLCGIHIKLEEPRKALAAASEAVKNSRHNWKIWENYTLLAVDNLQWGMAIEGFNGMLNLSIGKGSRAKKDRPLDARSLLFIVDAIVGPDTSSDNLTPSEVNLRTQLEKLVKRIEAECTSEANTWRVLFLYYDWIGNKAMAVSTLAKRCRSAQNANWEREIDDVKRVCKVAKEYAEYITTLDDEEVRKEHEYPAKKLVEMIANRARKVWNDEDEIIELEQALSQFKI